MQLPSKFWGLCTLVLCSTLFFKIEGASETLGHPIIKSLLQGSSERLKDFVNSHSNKLSSGDIPQNQNEINNLLSKLTPKQGKLDPVMAEMISAFDRRNRDTIGNSAETLIYPDETASGRIASSTEENGVIWQGTTYRPRKRDRDPNKFSSRYRSNTTDHSVDFHPQNTSTNLTDEGTSGVPFDHITDPNIRNHRLYDWEFETYKNFTHIDQAEDLMADEDHATETKVSIVAAPPPLNHPSQLSKNDKGEVKGESIIPSGWATKANGSKSKRVKVKGIPHIVISLEDTSDHGFGHGGVHVPGSYLKLPMDSGEPMIQRPREPLRHSSTENIVYVHGSAEDDKHPYSTVRDSNMHENDGRYSERSHKFRPSASDLSDAVFIDPEEDFFTSTVRSNDPHHAHQEISSETLPKRRRKKLRKITKQEEIDELTHSSRFSHRNGERYVDDGPSYNSNSNQHSEYSQHGIRHSPEYSRNPGVNEDNGRAHSALRPEYATIPRTPGSHLPIKPSKYIGAVENSRVKSDRILYPGSNPDEQHYTMSQGQPNYDIYETSNHPHDGGSGGNYYSHHPDPGLHSNLGMGSVGVSDTNPYPYQNHELTSTEYLGTGNRIQNALSALNIFGNPQNPIKKLQAAAADQVIAPGHVEDFFHPYATAEDQVNQYYDDAYYGASWSNTFFILAGIIAFTAIFAVLLPTFLTHGRQGKKDHRHDLDEEDLNTSSYISSSSNNNNNYHYDNTTDDVGSHPDVWAEIKGAYNDLVNLFRGDYSLLSKNQNKQPEGPKIVYRDEEDQEESEEDEDDEKLDNARVTLRNRKRERYVKKQQQLLQKQQQEQLKRQQQQRDGHSQKGKKTLVSKTKVEAGRDNKDGKTINATSVNNLVVVSGSSGPLAKVDDEEMAHSSPRAVTGFILPENSTLATIPFMNTTAGVLGSGMGSFLNEWAQVQLINNH